MKFAEEFNAWAEEKKDLEARLRSLEDSSKRAGATLAREAARRPGASGDAEGGRRRRRAPGFNIADVEAEIEQLEEELEHARDKEILLLEAYEQLERDIGCGETALLFSSFLAPPSVLRVCRTRIAGG